MGSSDLLKPDFTPDDVAHVVAGPFLQQALEYVNGLGRKVSKDCDRRFGMAWLQQHKKGFFRLCSSDAVLHADGSLGNVPDTTPLQRIRQQMANAYNSAAAMNDSIHSTLTDAAQQQALEEQLEQLAAASTAKRRLHAAAGAASPDAVHIGAAAPSAAHHSVTADAVRSDSTTAGGVRAQHPPAVSLPLPPRYQPELFEPDLDPPSLDASFTSYKSSVACYAQPHALQARQGSREVLLGCVGRNVVLDTCALYAGQREGYDVRLPSPRVGALALGCMLDAAALGRRELTAGRKNRMWWMAAVDNAYPAVRTACDPSSPRVVEHPVLFVTRDRHTHTYHDLEVMATIFTTLAITNLPEVRAQGLQVVIADSMPHASYRPTYAALSHPYRLRHLAEEPYPNGTCFRTALFVNAYTNSLTWNPTNKNANCLSPVMIAAHKWLRHLHRELDPYALAARHSAHLAPPPIIRRSVVWASRRTLEAARLLSGSGMTAWQLERTLPQENQLVMALQAAVMAWNVNICLLRRYYDQMEHTTQQQPADGAQQGQQQQQQQPQGCRDSAVQFDLVFGEFSDWPYYPDQLMAVYRSAVLVGVHGAALALIHSAPLGEAAVVELVPTGIDAAGAQGAEAEDPAVGGAARGPNGTAAAGSGGAAGLTPHQQALAAAAALRRRHLESHMVHLFPSLSHNVGAHYEAVHYTAPHVDPQRLAAALTRALDIVSDRIMAKRRATAQQQQQQQQQQQGRQEPGAGGTGPGGQPVQQQQQQQQQQAVRLDDQFNFDVKFPAQCPSSLANRTTRYAMVHEIHIPPLQGRGAHNDPITALGAMDSSDSGGGAPHGNGDQEA